MKPTAYQFVVCGEETGGGRVTIAKEVIIERATAYRHRDLPLMHVSTVSGVWNGSVQRLICLSPLASPTKQ